MCSYRHFTRPVKLIKFPSTFADGNKIDRIETNLLGAKANEKVEINMVQPKVIDTPDINLTPKLIYMTIGLQPLKQHLPDGETNIPRIVTRALIDTGCSKTTIDKECFDKLNKTINDKLPLNTDINVRISAATNAPKTQAFGTTTVNILFENETSQKITIPITILIVENLCESIIIGQDILGSQYVDNISKTHITFNINNIKIPMPVHTVHQQQLKCAAINRCKIPPHTPYLIACKLNRDTTNENKFILTNPHIKDLECLEVLYTTENKTFNVAVYNTSFSDIEIDYENTLFDIELIDNTVKINRIATVSDDDIYITESDYNNNNFNSYMNEKIKSFDKQEQEHQKSLLEKDHYFQPSISQIIKDKSSLTEVKLEDDKPITDAEFLEQFQISHLSQDIQNLAKKVFLKNKQAFSLHTYDIGHYKDIKMHIDIKQDAIPKMQKYHPIPLNAREQVKDILDQLIKYGIIRECHEPSPYCSNILVIKKKDGKSIRLLFDGRLLNYDTKKLPMALISKPEILSHLVGKKWLSSLDFSDAFYNIELDEESQPLTAFYSHTHGTRMCYQRLPQGLSCSPMYLKYALDKIFANNTQDILYYADDVLIATDGTLKNHLHVVDKTLQKLVRAGFKLRPAKLFLAQKHVEFLGMIFEKGKVSIPEKRLEAFKNLPSPTTPKKAKSVISCLSYYRHFCPRFAELAREILELGQLHPKQFKWTDELEQKYRQLIKTIIDNASIYLPDPNKPYYVQTDASIYCAAGRVFQLNDEKQEMLIAAVTRTFTKTERHYSIVKKEILALLYTLKTMDFFLRFADKLIILVDAKSIIYLRLAKDSSGILLRFSLELSKYEAELHHIPGIENTVSDVLSRHNTYIDEITEDIQQNITISEKDSIALVKSLTLPTNLKFNTNDLANLINGPSPLETIKKAKTKQKSKAKPGQRKIKNIPVTLSSKKPNLPKTTNYRPGMLLPINAMTRSKTKLLEKENETKTTDKESETNTTDTESETKTKPNDDTLQQTDTSENVKNIENKNKATRISKDDKQDYSTVKLITKTLSNGYLSIDDFILAQNLDQQCSAIIEKQNKPKHYYVKNNILFYKDKLVLPNVLYDTIINTKHFSIFGSHFSATKIITEVKRHYHLIGDIFTKKVFDTTNSCFLCQLYNNKIKSHIVKQLPEPTAPRQSWSIDLVTDTPTSKAGNNQILVCVDDFSSFVVCIPLQSASSINILNALKNYIFAPFGMPKIIRSDEQASIYNSNEFYTFLNNLGIELTATAVASPFSNARAESQIKNIKHLLRKYLFQQDNLDYWDDEISILTSIHNRTPGAYKYAPEEIMFGNRNPVKTDLITISEPTDNVTNYTEHILNKAHEIREKARSIMNNKKKTNQTFKNKNRTNKQFTIGDLVLHRQMQVSTGHSSKWKPLFTGPYIIKHIFKDNSTAMLEHLATQKELKAHFTNLQLLDYNPDTIKFNQNFDKQIKGVT